MFSLEDRPAPGLYFFAWLLSLGGAACLLVGLLAGVRGVSPVLALIGVTLLTGGLSAGAGYQVLARRDRHPRAYRGPSPLILFGIAVAVSTLVSLGVFGLRLLDASTPVGFLAGLLIVQVAHLVAVVLFVVRTRAMTWGDMGWPSRYGLGRFAEDLAYGPLVMLGATFLMATVAALLATLLGVRAPEILPTARSAADTVAIVISAAIVAPVGEELFFRGFALSAWQRDLGPRSALIRSSVFFALVHVANVDATNFREGVGQVILEVAVILPLGFLLGWIYQQRGIIASILGHVTYNSALLLVVFLARAALGPET